MSAEPLQALDPLLHPDIDRFNDQLHQESDFIERFYHLLPNIKPPFAISIDGPWGTGKTTVMQLLHTKCRNRGYPVFWFNPWKYSQSADVVLAFLHTLAQKHEPVLHAMQKSGGKLFKILLRVGLGTTLNVLTQGNVSIGDVNDAVAEEEPAFRGFKDIILEIEEEFRELAEAIGAEKEQKPLIIFLDDFDRCLPKDAIKLLEALKNLFVTKDCRVIFICGIDTRVAKNFIRDHYKVSDEFAINYFRKIFNLTISMPYHQNAAIRDLLTDYIGRIYDGEEAGHADALATQITLWGSRAEMVSVRKYLNVVHNFYAFLAFNPDYTFTPEPDDIIIHLLVIKEAWQPLYEELVKEAVKNRTASLKGVVETLFKQDTARKTPLVQPEQRSFLKTYSAGTDYPFYAQKPGNDILLRYLSLA